MRAGGSAVEWILRVLRQQDLMIAERTYRAWRGRAGIAERTVTDALAEEKIRELAWTVDEDTGGCRMTPEGVCGRRKRATLLGRQASLAASSRRAVDRAMRSLGIEGVRRAKRLRATVPGLDGKRTGAC